jgi:WD40 repeat protein
MRTLFISALLSACLSAHAEAQTDEQWRIICTNPAAQERARKSLDGRDLEMFELEIKFSCPRRDLPSKPFHDSADPSREASHTDWVYDARYSADGRTLLTASKDSSIGLWDVETGKLVKRILTPNVPAPGSQSGVSYLYSAAVVGDGTSVVAAQYGYPVLLYDVATGARAADTPLLNVKGAYRSRIGTTKNGLLVLAGDQDQVLVIDMVAKTVRHRLAGHGKDGPRAVAVSETADLVATALESDSNNRVTPDKVRPVHLWRLSTGQKVSELRPRGRSDAQALAFSRDGTQLAVLLGGTAHVLAVKDGSELRKITVHPFAGNDIAFTADGRGLITCQAHLMLWDLVTGSLVRHFGPFQDGCHSVDISPDGKFAVETTMASDVRIWEIATGTFHRRLGIDVKPPR